MALRWPGLLQRADDAGFVLDARRRVRFVNDAFVALCGLSADDARGLSCRRPRPPGPDAPTEDHVAHLLTPDDAGRARRLLRRPAGSLWCDVAFLSLGRIVVGRICPVAAPAVAAPLPDYLVALRQRRAAESSLALLGDGCPRLRHQVRHAATHRGPVLLLGPAGSGKATNARLIHHLSADRERPFAALDCARLPARAVLRVVLEERGPGTVYLRHPDRLPDDAHRRIAAWLEPAAAGSLPADEAAARPRLMGGTAALSGPLRDTLGVTEVAVPALAERRADLPALAEYALARLNDDGRAATTGLTAAAWDVLRGHPWPGNLTEFVAVLRDARHRSATVIDVVHLPAALRLADELARPPAVRPIDLEAVLTQAERRLIELALGRARGNRTRAAELLGLTRQKLLRRLETLGLGGDE